LRIASTRRCSSGKCPDWCFENTSVPSTTTSKIPPLPATSFGFVPNACSSLAARLTAFGS
jgi:hypothetical protein